MTGSEVCPGFGRQREKPKQLLVDEMKTTEKTPGLKWTDRKLRNNKCSSLDLRNGFLYKCQKTRAENLTDDVYEVKLITKSWVHVHRPPLTAGTSRLFWLSIFACSDLRIYRNPFRGRNRWAASILILYTWRKRPRTLLRQIPLQHFAPTVKRCLM